jgi:tRNA1(Val) A37 N6-methylase TrmN6
LTEDRLLGGRVVLRQPRSGFRAAIDTVLLAAAVPAKSGQRILDAGAGNGAAALCLAARVPGCCVVGLERDPDLVGLARENAELNDMTNRVEVRRGDIASPPSTFEAGSFDHAMMNPPHLRADRSQASPEPSRAAASQEQGPELGAWIDFALRMLRSKGTLTVIHRADRLDDLLATLRNRAGGVIVFPVWPTRDATAAKRVIVRARKAIATPLVLSPGLVLHEAGGGYTAAADAVLRGAALEF